MNSIALQRSGAFCLQYTNDLVKKNRWADWQVVMRKIVALLIRKDAAGYRSGRNMGRTMVDGV